MIELIIREVVLTIVASIAIIAWLWTWERVDYYFLCPERKTAKMTNDWSYFKEYRPWNLKEIFFDLFLKEWWWVILLSVIIDTVFITFSTGEHSSLIGYLISLF